MQDTTATHAAPGRRALKGVRVLSLALNLPGPAALMRCQQMGATCVKLEPLAPRGALPGTSGDPMGIYNPSAYATLHQGVRIVAADLKTEPGQRLARRELARADVLLSSFRPSAMKRLGLDWKTLHRQYPALSQVAIVGAAGPRAEEPGHDLTYLAQNDLVPGLELPATLYADMGGSLAASEAVLKAALVQYRTGRGIYLEVALSEAAAYLALPRTWGLTKPGAAVGGGHAGYRLYRCKNGRVAVAALEPHFAARWVALAGRADQGRLALLAPATHEAVQTWLLTLSCEELQALAVTHDLPVHTMPDR